jgi:hypothetical protein
VGFYRIPQDPVGSVGSRRSSAVVVTPTILAIPTPCSGTDSSGLATAAVIPTNGSFDLI